MIGRMVLAGLAGLLVLPIRSQAQPPLVIDWSFQAGADGNAPHSALLSSPDGGFYGTTAVGGPNGNGTAFHLLPKSGSMPATEQTIWAFTGGSDGSTPVAGLIADTAGALYGTTAVDGDHGRGTVFRLSPPSSDGAAWTEATLWGFSGNEDGGQPLGSLIADRSGSGVLYGTARSGGAHGMGVVFSLTPPPSGQGSWTQAVLLNFDGRKTGSRPQGALLQDSSGALYGTAVTGGAAGAGTVFKLTPPAAAGGAWSPSIIWNFSAGADGASPQGGLAADTAGALYGTAAYGGQAGCPAGSWPYYGEDPSVTAPTLAAPYVVPGQNGCGVVFRLAPPAEPTGRWKQTVLWSFTGGVDGDTPVSDLLPRSDGTLYGTTPMTAAGLKGTLFKLSPPKQASVAYTETTLLVDQHEMLGSYPRAGVVAGSDGRLYGTNGFGGNTWVHVKVYGYGSVYGALP